MQFIGYIQSVKGCALILGPSIGFGLNMIGGYDFLFYCFGTLFILTSLIVRCVFNGRVDENSTTSDQSVKQHEEDFPQYKIT